MGLNEARNHLSTQREVTHTNEPKIENLRQSFVPKVQNKDINNPLKNEEEINIEDYTDKKIQEGLKIYFTENKSKFIKRLSKGPPNCFRWVAWSIIRGLPENRNDDVYKNFVNQELEKENKERIIRDIERTFSDRNIQKNELRKVETSLYNVLKSYWNLDKEVGYCQGMNFIVGLLLILTDNDETETFYFMVAAFTNSFITTKKFDYSFRGLFSEEFPLLHLFNYIFDKIFEKQIPDLKKHLDQMWITYDIWIGQWFQTLFTIILPINWLQRLWDCIFAENIFFLIKFGIAFCNIIKKDLLSMSEEIEIIDYFKNLQKFSLCASNQELDNKCDINSLILKANKIKFSPEEYVKNFEKKNEF